MQCFALHAQQQTASRANAISCGCHWAIPMGSLGGLVGSIIRFATGMWHVCHWDLASLFGYGLWMPFVSLTFATWIPLGWATKLNHKILFCHVDVVFRWAEREILLDFLEKKITES